MNTDILNLNFNLKYNEFPSNLYALRVKDSKGEIFDISMKHNGFCPDISSEREQSNFNDYLSNLESSVVKEFFKSINIKPPKEYTTLLEVMTNEKGELYHFSRLVI